jgi:hypothetical protein
MSEAYRDRAPDMAGRLDLIERALAQIIATLERIAALNRARGH